MRRAEVVCKGLDVCVAQAIQSLHQANPSWLSEKAESSRNELDERVSQRPRERHGSRRG